MTGVQTYTLPIWKRKKIQEDADSINDTKKPSMRKRVKEILEGEKKSNNKTTISNVPTPVKKD